MFDEYLKMLVAECSPHMETGGGSSQVPVYHVGDSRRALEDTTEGGVLLQESRRVDARDT